MDPILFHVILFFSGILSSVINVMAGGGSIVTLSVMIAGGMDASVANASNRPGILAASVSSTRVFVQEKKIHRGDALILGICAIPGSIVGAIYASSIDSKLFERLIAITMIGVAISLFLPQRKGGAVQNSKLIYPVTALIGFYGGFIQLGVGMILMAAFKHLQNLPLLEVNARKMAITLLFTIPALVIFVVAGLVDWSTALVVALGNYVGAHYAARLAIKRGEKIVKIVLAIMTGVMAFQLLR